MSLKIAKIGWCVLVFVAMFAPRATAAPLIYVNFCPGDPSCPAGVTQASLSFTEVLGGDPNDYVATIVISGNASAPAFVDEVSFKIEGISASQYQSLPSLTSAPSAGAPWVPYFNNVNASAGSCVSSTGASQSVCSQSGPGSTTNFGAPLPSQTLTWQFSVNLVNSVGPLTATTPVNLRAQFLTSKGKNAGILSPNFVPTTTVPEPSSLPLVTLTMLALAWGTRRRTAGAR